MKHLLIIIFVAGSLIVCRPPSLDVEIIIRAGDTVKLAWDDGGGQTKVYYRYLASSDWVLVGQTTMNEFTVPFPGKGRYVFAVENSAALHHSMDGNASPSRWYLVWR